MSIIIADVNYLAMKEADYLSDMVELITEFSIRKTLTPMQTIGLLDMVSFSLRNHYETLAREVREEEESEDSHGRSDDKSNRTYKGGESGTN